MFTNTYLPHVGGVARSVSAFAEDLRARRHEVLVIAPVFPGCDELGEDSRTVLRVPAIQNFNGSDFSVRLPLPLAMRQQLDDFAPDIIHSHHAFLLGDAALRTARAQGVPLVFTHHTLYERYTHYVPFDSEAMERFVIHLATRYANLCQLVVAPSDSVADLIRRRGVETPCHVVPTGVDIEFFGSGDGAGFRRKHGIAREAFVIGHLGRLAPEKNVAYLSRAAAAYVNSEPGARFLVAGAGPSAAEIEQIFAAEGQPERLVHVGELQGEALRDGYAAMDLFCFASTSETQGMVLTEAMAASVPVVALDAPGVREVVEDGRNGRLLPADVSTGEFADTIAQCRDDRRRAAWQEQARRTAERFSRETTSRRLETVYRTALEDSRDIDDGLGGWDAWLRALRTEWDLLSEKTGAAISAVRSEEATRADLE